MQRRKEPLLKNGKIGMAGIVLCSVHALGYEIIRAVYGNCGSKYIQIPRRMVTA